MPLRSHSPEEIKKMQEDAIKKIKSIHQKNNCTEPKNHTENKKKQKHIYKLKKNSNIIKNVTSLIFKDPDKSLILILIVLLMDSEDNLITVLTLIYLLI